MQELSKEFDELRKEYEALEHLHTGYVKAVEKVKEEQNKCRNGIHHQRYIMKLLSPSIEKAVETSSGAELCRLEEMQQSLLARTYALREMEGTLPRTNGWYLSIVLGQVNVSLLSKQEKFAYKDHYERFKLTVTGIAMLLSLLLAFYVRSRVMETMYNFLLVWYYCTLTIREHILITNGSNIRGWWMVHHFISTAAASICLIWPQSQSYDTFRDQFMFFSVYLHFVQVMQYYYQKGMLYKLHALGERRGMEVTIDGFMTSMFRNLSFLMPFLFGAYIFQFYNSYVLYQISNQSYCKEWQVRYLSIIFFILFSGNTLSMLDVIRFKYFVSDSEHKRHLKAKFQMHKTG